MEGYRDELELVFQPTLDEREDVGVPFPNDVDVSRGMGWFSSITAEDGREVVS